MQLSAKKNVYAMQESCIRGEYSIKISTTNNDQLHACTNTKCIPMHK